MKITSHEVDRLIAVARQKYEVSGEIEIDEPHNASVARRMISEGEDWRKHGAYVKAWVWVAAEEIKGE